MGNLKGMGITHTRQDKELRPRLLDDSNYIL